MSSPSLAIPFPGTTLKTGSADSASVLAVQRRLNVLKCGPLTEDGNFGPETLVAVRLFQSRNSAPDGSTLTIDGTVGPSTWAALFGTQPAQIVAPNSLLAAAVAKAVSQLGVVEQPLNSNRGPQVDQYLRRVGLDPTGEHYSWCVAFVYWCFDEAAASLQRPNPLPRTAGVLDEWNRAAHITTATRIDAGHAQNQPGVVLPGAMFIMDHGGGLGHTGIVESIAAGTLTTIEGNTNPGGSREGYGVFRRSRAFDEVNTGYILYS
ncbi:MAG: hypothetical protein NVS9B15_11780 [Acidobacteriaceae bacterium]